MLKSFGKGCMWMIGAFVGLIIIIVVIVLIAAGGTSKHSSGTTKSPALVSGGSSGSGKAKTQVFKGTGSENIGTINVAADSTLHWSCPSCKHDNFQIFNKVTDDSQIGVNGLNQTSGKTVVDADLYHDVDINTEGGAWTIKIVPGT